MGEIYSVRRTRYDGSRGRVPDWSVPDESVARKCLTILAEEGGDLKVAAARCKDEDVYPVSAWDLERWRDVMHPKIWVDVHADNEKRLEQIAEAKARENAIRASVVVGKAVDRIDKQIADADLLGASKALDSLVKAQAASTTAVMQWSGRPVQGSAGGSAADTLKALEALGLVQRPVDGSVEEADVVDAETGRP